MSDVRTPATGLEHLSRPARALVGWMDPQQIELLFAGPNLSEMRSRAEAARSAVAGRLAGIDQSGAVEEIPPTLSAFTASLQSSPVASVLFQGGGRVVVADLSMICAAQPFIFTDHALDRVRDLPPADLLAIAEVSLPLQKPSSLSAQYDFVKRAYIFSSPDPNLRVLSNWNGEVQGMPVFGFFVAPLTSMINIGRYRDRYFLRDGYHRAYGFLARGIKKVPVITQDYDSFEHLGLPQGMLSQDAYLGERPPTLSDYLKDDVSISTERSATQRVVVIQASEYDALR
jgi:hypothetical protein